MKMSYTHLAHTYIRYVRRLSPSAATVLNEIRTVHGDQASYWVAFIIVASKNSLTQEGILADDSHYKRFLAAWPQVFPLAERALQCFITDRRNINDDDETQPTRPIMDAPASKVGRSYC
jgi:hypothetical protein